MKNVILPLILLIFALGCSKEASEFKPSVGVDVEDLLGPQLEDTNLAFSNENQPVSAKHQYLAISGVQDSAQVLELAQNLMKISSQGENRNEIGQLGMNLVDQFYAGNDTSSHIPFEESHLMQAVMAEVRTGFVEALDELQGQPELLAQVVRGVANQYDFNQSTWASYMDDVEVMIAEMMTTVENHPDLTDRVKESFLETFTEYSATDIPDIRAAIDYGQTENHAQALVTYVKGKLAEYNYEMDADQSTRLDKIDVVADYIDLITSDDAQTALTATVKLWNFLDEYDDEEGKLKFYDNNAELYAVLMGQEESPLGGVAFPDIPVEQKLACLEQQPASKSCAMIEDAFDRYLYRSQVKDEVLSQMNALCPDDENGVELETCTPEQQGPQNVQTSLNQSVSDGLRDTLWESALEVGDSIEEGVLENFDETISNLNAASSDIIGEVTPNLVAFGQSELGSRHVPFYEAQVVNVDMSSSESISASGFVRIDAANTTARSFGAGLSAMSLKWQMGQPTDDLGAHRAEVIGALNKMFSMGGYNRANGTVHSGIAQGLGKDNETYTFEDTDLMTQPYAIANSVAINGNNTGARSVSVGQQAAVLNGLVDMLDYLRDWQPNSFEPAFNDYLASDLLNEDLADLAGEEAERTFINKQDMYSLAAGQMAVFLKGMGMKRSLLVLLTKDDHVFIQNENTVDETEETIAVAAVGYTEGQRDGVIQVAETADFLYALTRAYHAIGQMQNTQAEQLTDRSEGESGLDQLMEAREDSIKSLIMGMAGFLTGYAKDANGAMAETVALDGFAREGVGTNLNTHAKVMRALSAASDVMEADVFDWAALEIYYYLNKNAWDPNLHFYKIGEDFDVYQLTTMIDALNAIRPALNEKSQQQLDKVVNRWIGALRTF